MGIRKKRYRRDKPRPCRKQTKSVPTVTKRSINKINIIKDSNQLQ